MKAIIYFLCFSLFLLFACNGEQTGKKGSTKTPVNSSPSGKSNANSASTETAIDYTTLAKAYCNCAENTVSINNKLAKLMDTDNAAFEALLPEAEKAFKDAMDCCHEAKAKQSTAGVDQQKLFKPLKKACPELPKQLMLKMVTEIK